jgi:hypothetical protein
MKIKLDLSRHCIETEIKHIYNQRLSEYFKSGSDKARLEQQIDTLKSVLENSDFNYLRGTYPELAGQPSASVTLTSRNSGELIIHINNRKIILSE